MKNTRYSGLNSTLVHTLQKKISELKENEEKLTYFQKAVDNSSDAIGMSTPQGQHYYQNKAFTKLFGLTVKQVAGKKGPPSTVYADEKQGREVFATIMGGGFWTGEVKMLNKDGRQIDIFLRAYSIKNEKGKVIGLIGVHTNITERKQAEELLKASESKFKSVVEALRDGVLAADSTTKKLVFANPAICALTGYSEKELLKLTVNDIHPKKDLPYVLRYFAKQVQGKIYLAKELPVLRKDKTIIYCDINAAASTIEGKDVLVGFFRDATERRKGDEALRQSESKYRTLLENLPQKIFFKDRNSVYISCNRNYARDLKIKPDKIAGKTDYEFYPKRLARRYRADDKKVMRSRKTADIEEKYLQNGKEKFVHTVKTPVKDENGKVIGILGIFWETPGKTKQAASK